MTQVDTSGDAFAVPSSKGRPPLSERTVRAGLLTTGGRLFTKCLDFVTLLILARYLGPEEFGLVAMAMTAVLIVETLSEMPLGAALLNHQHPTERMFDTALSIAALRALAIVALLCVMAWPLSLLYHEPRLIALQSALSLAPAMRGLVSQRLTEYARVMDFRRDVVLDIIAKAGALIIATILAITTGSYWAIAIGKISSTAFAMIASYFLAPQRIRFTLSEWHVFSDMLGWNAARQLLSAVNWQSDKVVLPRYVDIGTFGQFTWADNLIAVPAQAIIQPITPPLFSAFVMARQAGALGKIYLKASAGVYSINAPLFLSMGMLAGPIIHLILGPAWQETAPILTWLAFAAAIGYAPTVLLPALAMSLNRTRVAFEKLAIEFCVKVPLIIGLTMVMALQGLLIGHAVAAMFGFLVNLVLVRKLIRIGILAQLSSLVRPTLAMIPMALLLLATQRLFSPNDSALQTFFYLVGVSGLAVATFVGTALILWKLAGSPDSCESLFLRMTQKILSR
jgi:O-antigen/teichoic acid export membrane protein